MTNEPPAPIDEITFRLPSDAAILRETAAPAGWYAYYADVVDKKLFQMPVVLWTTVEYGDVDAPGDYTDEQFAAIDAASDAKAAVEAFIGVLAAMSAMDASGAAKTMLDGVVDSVRRIVENFEISQEAYEDLVGEPCMTQEIRPFILNRSGKVIDAHDMDYQLLCILGPGVNHREYVRVVMRERYPESEWSDGELPLGDN